LTRSSIDVEAMAALAANLQRLSVAMADRLDALERRLEEVTQLLERHSAS
jgi:hypothetical protein